MAESVIRHKLYIAEIVSAFGGDFGPALFELRKRYLPDDRVEDLAKNLSDARHGCVASDAGV